MDTFSGRLLTFHNDPFLKIPVFLSGSTDAQRCIITVGSQTDGFFVLTYMRQLTEEAAKSGWATAQVMLSSGFAGHGPRTHEQDAEDIDTLVALLVKEHNMKEITLFGFGTGVQVVLELMENGENTDVISRVVLQGIVVDPEVSYFTAEAAATRLAVASDLFANGNGEDMTAMKSHYDIPVSAARVCKGGSLSLMEAFWGPALAKDTVKVANVFNQVRVPLLLMIAFGVGYRLPKDDIAGFETFMQAAASTTELTINFFEDICDEKRRLLKAEDAKHVASIMFFLNGEDSKRTAREIAEEEERKEMERRSRSVLAKSKLRLL